MKGLWNIFFTAFPDLTVSVDELISAGDMVVTRWVAHGRHQGEFLGLPASNCAITLPAINIVRVGDGMLLEAWDQYDRQYLMEQIHSKANRVEL